MKKRLRAIYKEIGLLVPSKTSFNKRADLSFRNVARSSFVKAFEFNEIINAERTRQSSSFFYMASLRGICEDLITLNYIKRTFSAKDRDQVMVSLYFKNLSEHVLAQTEFFRLRRPLQPIFKGSTNELRESIHNCERELQELGAKANWGKNKSFPSVSHMATHGRLIKLYSYLYHATSDLVHFSPHTLLRMGWGPKEEVVFSTRNFKKYYHTFSQFYGTYLFVQFWEFFKDILGLDKRIKPSVNRLKAFIEEIPRWPEIVTFEEMNQVPPNFGRALVQAKLLADMSADERHNLVRSLLRVKGKKRLSSMNTEKKRKWLNKLSDSEVPDKVRGLTDAQLNEVLEDINEDFLQLVKKKISIEEANTLLLGIPATELIELIKLIPDEKE